ncbi:MAG: hypothetical protein JXL97_14510 [Bacteroidales bacterium]|nr:hypothetical protein [Bacteroidales bacterium]
MKTQKHFFSLIFLLIFSLNSFASNIDDTLSVVDPVGIITIGESDLIESVETANYPNEILDNENIIIIGLNYNLSESLINNQTGNLQINPNPTVNTEKLCDLENKEQIKSYSADLQDFIYAERDDEKMDIYLVMFCSNGNFFIKTLKNTFFIICKIEKRINSGLF